MAKWLSVRLRTKWLWVRIPFLPGILYNIDIAENNLNVKLKKININLVISQHKLDTFKLKIFIVKLFPFTAMYRNANIRSRFINSVCRNERSL